MREVIDAGKAAVSPVWCVRNAIARPPTESLVQKTINRIAVVGVAKEH
jgi:hypothetical protein